MEGTLFDVFLETGIKRVHEYHIFHIDD